MEAVGGATLITLCLAVLSTRVRYERDKNGKFSLLIDKKALGDGTLKKFMEMLMHMTWK
jgi:hypothetical protein